MSTPVSCTVTVHVLVVWLKLRTVSGQFKVVVVTWPAVTVVVPVSVSRLKKPLHATGPGTQSLVLEVVLLLARVSVCRPMIAPVGLKALSGNEASIEALLPLAQVATKLQLCSVAPTVVN